MATPRTLLVGVLVPLEVAVALLVAEIPTYLFTADSQTYAASPGSTTLATTPTSTTTQPVAIASPTMASLLEVTPAPTLAPPSPTPPEDSPTPTATATPTDTPTPGLALATATPLPTFVVANTGGDGANLRRSPSTKSERLRTIPEGTVVTSTGPSVSAEGAVWYPVRDPRGASGWIQARYLALRPPASG